MKPSTVLLVFAALPLFAQHENHGGPQSKAGMLLPGLGSHQHPISTSNPEAQRFFNQGLTLVFGFNHEEAVRSFKRAADLDRKAAMALWGVALALGPNINMDVDPEREKAAYDAVRKALALSKGAPPIEQSYIQALAKRYSNDPKADLKALAVEYANAMRELTKRYPDDLDAATLFAESMMDLNPWKLWTKNGKPAAGTLEIVAVLESVLRRKPDHIGANHYYIHAVEASPNPERALPSADRLAALTPGAGHLVHMPGHIYIQLGDYETVARTNQAAAEADRRYMKLAGAEQTMYGAMYYTHNLHFLMVARAAQGRYTDAKKLAGEIASNVAPVAEQMPMVQPFLAMPMFVDMQFHRWDSILAAPQPDSKMALLTALSHFGRASAYVAKADLGRARTEQQKFIGALTQVPQDLPWGVNQIGPVMDLAKAELAARIAEAQGDRTAAIERWKSAAAAQDAIPYDEPPPWYYNVRESLGGLLLRAGRHAEAEAVFRENLRLNPRSPRSLFGLLEAVKAQKKAGAEWLQPQLDSAWKHAEVKLSIADL
jgi:tetratricopeptide (TPR) repeat protein